jgi:4-hydroxyacetophenone monooxygenase
MIYGPNTNPTGGAGNPSIHEMGTRFIVSCLAHLISVNGRTVDVTSEAYQKYNIEVDQADDTRIYTRSGVKNYYTNEHGRSAGNCPFDSRKMWDWLRDPTGRYAKALQGSTINAGSHVRPYFGQDLLVE